MVHRAIPIVLMLSPEDDALREEECLELLDAVDLLPRLDGVGPPQPHVAQRVVGAHPQVVHQVARHQHASPTEAGVAVHGHLQGCEQTQDQLWKCN